MGIRVKEVESGKDKGKFVLTWSMTGQSSEPVTKAEAILCIHEQRMADVQIKFIEDAMAFPDGWGRGGMHVNVNEEGRKAYHKWMDETLSAAKDDDEFHRLIDVKYNEVMEQVKKETEGRDEK